MRIAGPGGSPYNLVALDGVAAVEHEVRDRGRVLNRVRQALPAWRAWNLFTSPAASPEARTFTLFAHPSASAEVLGFQAGGGLPPLASQASAEVSSALAGEHFVTPLLADIEGKECFDLLENKIRILFESGITEDEAERVIESVAATEVWQQPTFLGHLYYKFRLPTSHTGFDAIETGHRLISEPTVNNVWHSLLPFSYSDACFIEGPSGGTGGGGGSGGSGGSPVAPPAVPATGAIAKLVLVAALALMGALALPRRQ